MVFLVCRGTDLSVPRLPRSALVGVRCCLRKPLRQHLTACLMDVARPRIDERAYLGTDKSVPYRELCKYTDSADLHRFTRILHERIFCTNESA
ncbi:MAG: hypothetical protein FWG87_03630 [Defluviitaleaceae bacterium]|nr:hypothetical protein [Defluviitaleaceae bacterium]